MQGTGRSDLSATDVPRFAHRTAPCRRRLFARAEQRCAIESAVSRRQRFDDQAVVLRGCYNRDVLKILRAGADHRRSADVDVLDHFLELDSGFANRLDERIEIDTNKVDQLDMMLSHLLHMFGVLPDRQQTARNPGIQGLHPAIEDFRKSRQIRHLPHWYAVRSEQARCAARGNDFDVEADQSFGKLDNARFVIHADQRTFDSFHIAPACLSTKAPLTLSQYQTRPLPTSITAWGKAMEAIPDCGEKVAPIVNQFPVC